MEAAASAWGLTLEELNSGFESHRLATVRDTRSNTSRTRPEKLIHSG